MILAEIAEDDLDIETKRAMKEQTERDKRIKLQQEREESARLERIRKQKEYNGDIITAQQQQQKPVAFELVLETDLNTNNIIIEVDLMLVQYMKQHQGKIRIRCILRLSWKPGHKRYRRFGRYRRHIERHALRVCVCNSGAIDGLRPERVKAETRVSFGL